MENWIRQICEPRRLYLAWQAPDHMRDRFRWAVAELCRSDEACTLRYLAPGKEFEAFNQDRSFDQMAALGYQGYPAFSLRRPEHSLGVLEALMRRLPPRNRPDYNDYRRQFRIAPDATPSDFALVGATEAKLPSDGFSVVDPLDPEASNCDLMLEIAGFRYYSDKVTSALEVGQSVELHPEPQNEKDPGAVKVCVRGERIGYINRLQAPTFLRWIAERHVSATLERLNGSPNHPRAFIFVRIRAANSSKRAA
jgi:hypothetical protein